MTTELTKAAPSFMADPNLTKEVNALAAQYTAVQRLKIVQATAKPPISDRFQKGDVILTPTLELIAEKGKPFQIVPLFFAPEWIIKNPLEAQVSIAGRSWDATSDIAKRSRNPEARQAPWDGDPKKSVRYLEQLHFFVLLYGHPTLNGMQAAMTFSSAEHKTGTAFSSSLIMRNVPMFGTVWDVVTASRSNQKGTWHGFNITANVETPFVQDEELFNKYRDLNLQLREAHKARTLGVAEEDDDEAAPSTEF